MRDTHKRCPCCKIIKSKLYDFHKTHSFCKPCSLIRNRAYKQSPVYKKKQKERTKKWYEDNKKLVFDHYGHTCAKCGFSDIRALSIDHIKGNGSQHKRDEKISGSGFYRWLMKNNFPDGFQTLCMNCQFIKRHENNEWFKLPSCVALTK